MVRGHQDPRATGDLTVIQYAQLICGAFFCVLENGELIELEFRKTGFRGP